VVSIAGGQQGVAAIKQFSWIKMFAFVYHFKRPNQDSVQYFGVFLVLKISVQLIGN
jgi:hypothetical protein